MSNFYNIPQELRDINCWVLWRYVDKGGPKPTKVPYQTNGYPADPTDPREWTSFEAVHNTLQIGGYDGLGFVFDDSHPYAFIDLDNPKGDPEAIQRQIKIFNDFDSYSEKSPSGKGLHIIIKGKIPKGKRSDIELYSHNHYGTMTGDVFHNKPIEDRQANLTNLYDQIVEKQAKDKVNHEVVNQPQTQEDADIVSMAANALNGEKFLELYQGDWKKVYPEIAARQQGPSEADQALINIITFYTKNVEQISRIFKASVLGKRKKIYDNKSYLPNMIKNAFDQTPPTVDFDAYIAEVQEQLDKAQVPVPVAQPIASTIPMPPGLVGEIAQFVYDAAPRQVPEVALAAALGLMAGVCGRSYNISGTGLNQYILLLAMTGTGKESLASGIDKLVNEVQKSVPVASEFLGPSEIASGQALVKYLANKSQCFVSILGEFGLRLRAMASQNANSAEISLRRMLLDLYNKSGHGQVARPSIYADADKNTNAISSPAFSILGESTPERFYDILNEEMITEGLLPRFMLIEYNGKRPRSNPNHVNVQPHPALIEKVAGLMAQSKTLMSNRVATKIAISAEALEDLNAFDRHADDQINNSDKEVVRHLWNRAHIKVLKISGLLAVGNNYMHPEVQLSDVVWAKNIVVNDINQLSSKFEKGQVGISSGEIRQIEKVKKTIRDYIIGDFEKLNRSYKVPAPLYHARMISWSYLQRRLVNDAAFTNDKSGVATIALKRTIKVLIDAGFISEVPMHEVAKIANRQLAYMVSDMSDLMES